MTNQRSFAVTLFPLLSTAAALHTAFLLVAFRETPIADHLGMGIWWFFLLAYQIVMTNFLKAPRELRSIVILSGGFVIAQLIVTIVCNPVIPSFTGWLAIVAMWIATYYRCANTLLVGEKPESLMVNFETIVLTLLFTAAVVNSGAMASGILIHLCLSLFFILIAMMRQRTLHTRIDTQNQKNTANLVLPLILLGIAALVGIFCVIISGSAASILTQITTWFVQLLRAAAGLIGAFFTWLFSLFPQEFDPAVMDAVSAEPLPSGEQEQVTTSNGMILYVMIISIVAALVYYVLKLWRKVHLQGHTVKTRAVRTVVVKKNSLWESLERFFGRILRIIRFNLQYLRLRNTAPGLLVWLERQMRKKRQKRKQGETTLAFLTRIGTEYPLCQEELADFARQLDRYYFGGGKDISAETIRQLRKKVKHAFSQGKQTEEKKAHS